MRKYQNGGEDIQMPVTAAVFPPVPKWQNTINSINTNWGPDQLGRELDLNTLHLIATERRGVQDPQGALTPIQYHETGSHQRMQPNAVQIAEKNGKEYEGDGKGYYMYDRPSTLRDANRLRTIAQNMGMETPGFVTDLINSDGTANADTLTADQQDMLMLANLIQDPKAPFSAYGRGEASLEDLWYRGVNRREDEQKARAEFRESYKAYQNEEDMLPYFLMGPKPNYFEQKAQEKKTGGQARKGNAFERFSNALKSRKKDAPKQSNIFRSYTIEKPKEESPSGNRLDKKSWASLAAKMSYKTGGVTEYQQGGPRKLVEVNGELVSVGLNATDEEVQAAYEEQYAPKPAPAPQPKPKEEPKPQPRPQPRPQPQPAPEPPARQPEPAPTPARDTIPVESSEEGPTISLPVIENPDFGVPTTPPEEAPETLETPRVPEEPAWYEGIPNYFEMAKYLGDAATSVGNKISDNLAFLQDGIMRDKDLSEEFEFLPEGSNLGVLRGLTDFIGFTIPDDEVGEFSLENEDVFRGPDGPEVPPEAYPFVYGTTADGEKYLTNFQNVYLDNDRDYPGGETRNFWSYRNQYLNEDGFQFVPFTHKQGLEAAGQTGIEGVQGIGHFLIDADPTKPRTEAQAASYLSRLDEGAYVPIFKTEENGRITLKYVNSRDQYEEMNANGEWSPLANLRQFKASDVDWDVNDTPWGNQHKRQWDRGITNYKLKDGTDTYIPWKRHEGPSGKLGRFNGATVTYLFTDPESGKLVVRDFTGKAQEIRDEVGKIQERFGISQDDITIGFYDAGSYSAKPVANSEGFVPLDNYRTFNTQGTSGAGLAIPADYRPSPDLIFDANAWKTGGARPMSKYFKKKLKRK